MESKNAYDNPAPPIMAAAVTSARANGASLPKIRIDAHPKLNAAIANMLNTEYLNQGVPSM